ncbi:hypothetical protein HOO65_070522 [Ceratocystis lukuohia]|uniref:Uncharacterized protein n=1 Tax=Ceratocystis lukuohia TaxID=2019550 RepID=A0ABR4MCR1_9PEZI
MEGLDHQETLGGFQWPPLPAPFPHSRPQGRPALQRDSFNPVLDAIDFSDHHDSSLGLDLFEHCLSETMPSYHPRSPGAGSYSSLVQSSPTPHHVHPPLPPPPPPPLSSHLHPGRAPGPASAMTPVRSSASGLVGFPYSDAVSVSPKSPTRASVLSSSAGARSATRSHRYTTMDSDHALQTAQLAAAASIFKSLRSARTTPPKRSSHTTGRSSLREYLKNNPIEPSLSPCLNNANNSGTSSIMGASVTPAKTIFSKKFDSTEFSSSLSRRNSGRLGRTLGNHKNSVSDLGPSVGSSSSNFGGPMPAENFDMTPQRPLRGTKSMTFLEKPFRQKTTTRFGGGSRATFLRSSSLSRANRFSEASTVTMTKKPYNIRQSVRLSSASTDIDCDMSSLSVATDKSHSNSSHARDRFLRFFQGRKKKAPALLAKKPQSQPFTVTKTKSLGFGMSGLGSSSMRNRRAFRNISWHSMGRSSMEKDEDDSRPSTTSTDVAELTMTVSASTAAEDGPCTPVHQTSQFYGRQFEYCENELSPSIHTVRIVNERPALQHPSPQSPEHARSPQDAFFRTSPTFRTTIRRQMDEEQVKTSSMWGVPNTVACSDELKMQRRHEDDGTTLWRASSIRDDASSVYSNEYQSHSGSNNYGASQADVLTMPECDREGQHQPSYSIRNASLTSSADWNMIPESISPNLWAYGTQGSSSTLVHGATGSKTGHGHVRERAVFDGEDEPMFGYSDHGPPSVAESVRSVMRDGNDDEDGDIAMEVLDPEPHLNSNPSQGSHHEPGYYAASAAYVQQSPQESEPCVVEELARYLKDVTIENRQDVKLKRSTPTKGGISSPLGSGGRQLCSGKSPKQKHPHHRYNQQQQNTRNHVSPGRRMAESFLENRRRQQEQQQQQQQQQNQDRCETRRDFSGAFI